MFYAAQLVSRDGPLQVLWIAATLDRQLNRQLVEGTAIPRMVEMYLAPDAPAGIFSVGPETQWAGERGGASVGGGRRHKGGRGQYGAGGLGGVDVAPLALRLSGQLLLGVCRIYSRKVVYLLEDCEKALLFLRNVRHADTLLAHIALQPNDPEQDSRWREGNGPQSRLRLGSDTEGVGVDCDIHSGSAAAVATLGTVATRAGCKRGDAVDAVADAAAMMDTAIGGTRLLLYDDDEDVLLEGGGGIQRLQTTGSLELLLGGSGARFGMGLTYKATLETGPSSQGFGLGDDDGMCDECFEEMPDHFEFDLDEHEIEALRAHHYEVQDTSAQLAVTATAATGPAADAEQEASQSFMTPAAKSNPSPQGSAEAEEAAEAEEETEEARKEADKEAEEAQQAWDAEATATDEIGKVEVEHESCGAKFTLAAGSPAASAAVSASKGTSTGSAIDVGACGYGMSLADGEAAGHPNADGHDIDVVMSDAVDGSPDRSLQKREALAAAAAVAKIATEGAAVEEAAGCTPVHDNDMLPTLPRPGVTAAPHVFDTMDTAVAIATTAAATPSTAATTTTTVAAAATPSTADTTTTTVAVTTTTAKGSSPMRTAPARREAALRAQAALAATSVATTTNPAGGDDDVADDGSGGGPAKKKRKSSISPGPAAAMEAAADCDGITTTTAAVAPSRGDGGRYRQAVTLDVDREGRIRVCLPTQSLRELLQDRSPLLKPRRHKNILRGALLLSSTPSQTVEQDSAQSFIYSAAVTGCCNSPWLAIWQRLAGPQNSNFSHLRHLNFHANYSSCHRDQQQQHPQEHRWGSGSGGGCCSPERLLQERSLDAASGPVSVPSSALSLRLQHLFHVMAGRPGDGAGEPFAGPEVGHVQKRGKKQREVSPHAESSDGVEVRSREGGGRGSSSRTVSSSRPGEANTDTAADVNAEGEAQDGYVMGIGVKDGTVFPPVVIRGTVGCGYFSRSSPCLSGGAGALVEASGAAAAAAAAAPLVSTSVAGSGVAVQYCCDGGSGGALLGKVFHSMEEQVHQEDEDEPVVEEADEQAGSLLVVENSGAVSELPQIDDVTTEATEANGDVMEKQLQQQRYGSSVAEMTPEGLPTPAADGFTARTQAVLRTLQGMAMEASVQQHQQHPPTHESTKRRRVEAEPGTTQFDGHAEVDVALQVVTTVAELLKSVVHLTDPRVAATHRSTNDPRVATSSRGVGGRSNINTQAAAAAGDEAKSCYRRIAAARTFYDLLFLSNRGYICLETNTRTISTGLPFNPVASTTGSGTGADGDGGHGPEGGAAVAVECVAAEQLLVVARARLTERAQGQERRQGQGQGQRVIVGRE